jgi:RNA polymerase sigma-70 factor (ECF subfamily)
MEFRDDSTLQLIVAARNADHVALSRLLEHFRSYLRLLARTGLDASLRGKADPSDLVQDTMLKASKNFARFRGESEAALAAWLRQILVQCLIDQTRRFRAAGRDVARERSLNRLLNKSSRCLEGLVVDPNLRSDLLPRGRDAGVLLADAMSELATDQREVITLRNLEQLEWAEIAARLGRSPDAARMLWVRALKQLRPLVEARL